MKLRVCKHCGEIKMAVDVQGKEVCPFCDGRDFEDREVSDKTKVECIHCKRERTIGELLKIWTTIPFFNINSMTYYDGCRGWD